MHRVSQKFHGVNVWVLGASGGLQSNSLTGGAHNLPTTDGIMHPPRTTEDEVAYRPQLQSVCSSVIDDFIRPLFASGTFPKPSKSHG